MKNNLTSDEENIYFSENFDKQSALLCLEKNFLNILPATSVNQQVKALSKILDTKSSIKEFAYVNDKILFFHAGKIKDNAYIVNIFCWNFNNKRHNFYKHFNIVKKNLTIDIKLKYPNLQQLIIPVLKNRFKEESYKKLLKKTFKNIKQEQFILPEYEDFDIFSVNLQDGK